MKRYGAIGLLSLLVATAAYADLSSRNQRRTIVTMFIGSMPQPDDSLDSGDRAQLIGIYRGQLEPEVTSTGSTGTTQTIGSWIRRRR